MSEGTAGRKYYLSSLDPGMGKTTSIVTWIRAYRERFKGDCPTGLLICVERLNEIERYVKDCKLPEDSYAVLAGKYEIKLNALGLGHENIDKALVLFTTKAQIRRRSQGISIDTVNALHFKGQPRGVKVWDESLLIGKDIVINPYDFGRLYTPLSKLDESLVSVVQQVMTEILTCESGSVYIMPELPELPRDYFEKARGFRKDDIELLDLFWRLSGQAVSIRKNGNTQVVVDCIQSIPSDFPPCVILDASGRIKETYRVQKEKLKNLIELPYSNKSYRNLTINVWDRAAGKGIRKDLKTVTPELVKLIKQYVGEEFLFLLHKDTKDDSYLSLSKHLSKKDMERLSFCTYGQHTATNEFCKIPNIIALSAFQFPETQYEAITRAAGMMTTENGVFPSQEEIDRVKRGEIASEFLQGVTRGLPRKSEGDTCPPSRLWLICHPTTGLRKQLPVIFPDASIRKWETQNFKLTKRQQEVFDLIHGQVKEGETVFPTTPILSQLKMEHRNFSVMSKNPNFKKALNSLKTSITEDPRGWFITVMT